MNEQAWNSLLGTSTQEHAENIVTRITNIQKIVPVSIKQVVLNSMVHEQKWILQCGAAPESCISVRFVQVSDFHLFLYLGV